jgi:hypothetical protein
MPNSSAPPPLISVPRITTLIASLIVATSAGTRYVSEELEEFMLHCYYEDISTSPSGLLR